MRLVVKTPLLAADAADVVTTKLITPAAAGNPASKNNSTNGLLSADISCHELTEIMQIRDAT